MPSHTASSARPRNASSASGTSQSTTSSRASTKPNPAASIPRSKPYSARSTDTPDRTNRKTLWNSSTSVSSKRATTSAPSSAVRNTGRENAATSSTAPTVNRPHGRRESSGFTKSSQPRVETKRLGGEMLKNQYEALLATKNTSDAQLRESLRKLRRMVLTEGLPVDLTEHSARDCSLRGRIWKVLLGIYRVSSSEYFTLIERGPSPVHDKIRNDTFRTLATDKTFCARVREDMLTRVLSSFVWKMHNRPTSRLLNLTFSYVQGMNVLAAPFLYVMPELDAFYTFNTFIQYSCPLYVQPALEGVHCGLKLLDRCLQVLDPGLFRFLKAKNLSANIWAFPSVMTLCACTPPLENVLQLWDFLLSYGIHLNILCIISQLMLMRPQLISSAQPMKLLRRLPELNAREIIKHALTLVQRLPEDLYDMLVRHPFDAGVYEVVMGEDGVGELGWDGRWGWEDDRSEMSEE